MKKAAFFILLFWTVTACEPDKSTPVEKSVGLLVKSMEGEGKFSMVENVLVADQAIRPDWKVMENREAASWDWARLELQKRVGEHPKIAKMTVKEQFIGSETNPISTQQAFVLLTFEGAPDTMWLHCGLNTGYILNLGFWEKGGLVTDAAD
jgi:hypothetical protein